MSQSEKTKINIKCLSSYDLKLIAVITMTIDHVGAVLLPQYRILRCIGRIAFPIYCFMLVNGLFHTKNVLKYLGRMILLAVISEVFFDLTFFNSFITLEHQNVFMTLTIGLLMLILVDENRRRPLLGNAFLGVIAEGACVVLCAGIAYYLRTDYSLYGILMIYGFYVLRYSPFYLFFFELFITKGLMRGRTQMYCMLAFIPVFLYNGKIINERIAIKDEKINEKMMIVLQWFFYLYYPIHLFVLFCVRLCFT